MASELKRYYCGHDDNGCRMLDSDDSLTVDEYVRVEDHYWVIAEKDQRIAELEAENARIRALVNEMLEADFQYDFGAWIEALDKLSAAIDNGSGRVE